MQHDTWHHSTTCDITDMRQTKLTNLFPAVSRSCQSSFRFVRLKWWWWEVSRWREKAANSLIVFRYLLGSPNFYPRRIFWKCNSFRTFHLKHLYIKYGWVFLNDCAYLRLSLGAKWPRVQQNWGSISINKPCDEALGAAQGSLGQTDLELESLRAWVFELGWTGLGFGDKGFGSSYLPHEQVVVSYLIN